MEKMLFASRMPEITITALPDGKRDITALTNEEEIAQTGENGENTTMYQYDGNRFRTVYELTKEEIKADMGKYLNYTAEGEPTLEQMKHDNDLIDNFTMELIEGGVL